jgi:hypothetical protein
MANTNKSYLDLQGLQTYDEKIKNYIQDNIILPSYRDEDNSILFDFVSNQNDNEGNN